MANSEEQPLLCTFESRRAAEMGALIERSGGAAFVAPSMQEVPLENNPEAVAAIERVLDEGVTHLVLLTGVGTEAMLEVAASQGVREALLQRMQQLPLLVRGPKPAAVLGRLGLKYTVKAPEPNTWKELLTAIEAAEIDLAGSRIAVQEYGVANPSFYEALQERGADVLPVPVYRWALPDDTQPLQQAIARLIAGEFAAVLFTSAQQVRHVLQVAEREGSRDQWLKAANESFVASIGPTCTGALEAEGLRVGFEASPPKMGPLVRGVMEQLCLNETGADRSDPQE